jgi:hypothetical protein
VLPTLASSAFDFEHLSDVQQSCFLVFKKIFLSEFLIIFPECPSPLGGYVQRLYPVERLDATAKTGRKARCFWKKGKPSRRLAVSKKNIFEIVS